ncbi:PLP-dependent transferase [Escherichia coli]
MAEKPKLVLVESPSNPLLRVVDIAKICHLASSVTTSGSLAITTPATTSE